jgi:hypothetical protein
LQDDGTWKAQKNGCLTIKPGNASFYLQRTDKKKWVLEFTIVQHLCHDMYWEDGKTTKFKNGTDIALAVVEVTDPIRLAAAMGDLKSQLSKIPEPKPFKGTFRN